MLAALVNGATGHSQDYDDDHREGTQHSSVAVLPAVLALAEKYGKSGKDALLAYIIGSEVTIRAGEAFNGTSYYAGWHLTGTCGVFGSAAGAAKIMGLNTEQMVNALAVAGSTSPAWVNLTLRCVDKRFHPGRAAMDGILAAYMGKNNFFGPPTVFEGKEGFSSVFPLRARLRNRILTEISIPKINSRFRENGRWQTIASSCMPAVVLQTTSVTVLSISITRAVMYQKSNPSMPNATSSPMPSSAGPWTSSVTR